MGGGLVGRVGRRVRDVVVRRVRSGVVVRQRQRPPPAPPSCGAGAPLLSPFFVRREVDLRRGMASGWPGAELVLWVLMVLRCETVPRADPPRRRVAAWRAAFSPRSARFASWSDACSRQFDELRLLRTPTRVGGVGQRDGRDGGRRQRPVPRGDAAAGPGRAPRARAAPAPAATAARRSGAPPAPRARGASRRRARRRRQ